MERKHEEMLPFIIKWKHVEILSFIVSENMEKYFAVYYWTRFSISGKFPMQRFPFPFLADTNFVYICL